MATEALGACGPKLLGCYLFSKRKVDSIGETPQNPDGTIKGAEDDEAVKKVHPTVMDTVAVAGVGCSIATMALTEGHIVDLASMCTIGITPFAAYQKRSLNALGGMRGQQNQLREYVNDLALENNKLAESVDGLEEEVSKLEVVEGELNDLAKGAQTNVDRLVAIVKENGELQAQIKTNLQRQVIQQVLGIVLQSDRNQDYQLNKMEMEMMILRLKNIPGIEFDEANFRKQIKAEDDDGDGTLDLNAVVTILRNLMDDDVPEEENIFHMHPDELIK
mmetsp:Transcript_50535/g.75515  ORF Transcript_50535/g.75515 Transcript_50535/m.75515 type:complete len:276 (-) Transcript_50535:214-1041(-)|eukprot:CAMPEP_0194041750 /NCGR_PEP_ID=MMETSP0009_2-20130614/13594_1 /TAXON_ID=210454 /ORGANISM="Grammatophora oceanica, Strain CCMP 410" /LENGTH=275 /DNA_ID=CAMNT_0038685355 /DNA_START=59 /DNA_END=886 /DNA_ORIENTATION=-